MPGIGVNGTGAVFLRHLRVGDLAIIVAVIGGVHVLSLESTKTNWAVSSV